MEIPGRVHNGVVILDSGVSLPEGTEVVVSCRDDLEPEAKAEGKRVEFPLVRSKNPGSVHLTGERIAEILDEEDVSP